MVHQPQYSIPNLNGQRTARFSGSCMHLYPLTPRIECGHQRKTNPCKLSLFCSFKKYNFQLNYSCHIHQLRYQFKLDILLVPLFASRFSLEFKFPTFMDLQDVEWSWALSGTLKCWMVYGQVPWQRDTVKM